MVEWPLLMRLSPQKTELGEIDTLIFMKHAVVYISPIVLGRYM